jgi:hypothetical protein
MDEMTWRQRRDMRRAVARGVLIVAVFALASPFAVSAQATTTPPRATRPLLLVGGETSRPLHEAASIGTVIALRPLERGSDWTSGMYAYRGVVLEAAVGVEGYGFAAGWGQRMKAPGGPVFYGTDIMATWFRTQKWAGAERVSATYAGAEVGVPLFVVPMTRLSLGAARRVAGPATVDRTIFTWGIGVLVGG